MTAKSQDRSYAIKSSGEELTADFGIGHAIDERLKLGREADIAATDDVATLSTRRIISILADRSLDGLVQFEQKCSNCPTTRFTNMR